MFRRILVPVDSSPFAEHALPYAAKIASAFDAQLELALVHVNYEPATADINLREAIHEWERDHRCREADYLREIADRLSAETGRSVDPVLLSGDVVPALEQEIRQRGTDLVIMTTHGRAGFERAWLGSVADSLVRHVEPPVLLIRPAESGPTTPAERLRFAHIVVALDGSDRARRTLAPVIALARADESRVTLLRVIAPPVAPTSPFIPHAAQITRTEIETRAQLAREYVAQEADSLRMRGIDATGDVVLDHRTAHAVLDHAQSAGANLIAVGSHGRGPITRFMIGSVSDKVVRGAEIPVLVC